MGGLPGFSSWPWELRETGGPVVALLQEHGWLWPSLTMDMCDVWQALATFAQ